MSDNGNEPDDLAEARELILALLASEQLEAPQLHRLEELAGRYEVVRRLYVMLVHQRCVISAMAWPASAALNLEPEPAAAAQTGLDETLVTGALRLEAAEEPAVEAPTYRQQARERRERELMRQQRIRWMGLAAVVVAVIGLGALVLVLTRPEKTVAVSGHRQVERFAQGPQPPPAPSPSAPARPVPPAPAPPPLAMLLHQIGAHWAGNGAPVLGQGIAPGDKQQLLAGVAELRFSTGATMIVEGPADFSIGYNSAQLRSGRLAADVPPGAHGFAVDTPQSKVIDRGTELGVEVRNAVTEVDVFKGTVEAQPISKASAPMTLIAGRAAVVTIGAVSLQPQGAQPQQFVRELYSSTRSLDVVDLICGGVGTHLRGKGVDVRDGEYGPIPPAITIRGDRKFHPVGVAMVDGCFVPEQRVVIDSAGDSFDFGTTSGRTFSGIDAGNPMRSDDSPLATALSGIDYAGPGHGFLLVHASSGLTLDLAKIRRLFPDKSLSRFRAVVGNTATQKRRDGSIPKTTVLVLVDGQVHYQRTFTPADGGIAVDVPLQDSNRFLTLASVERRISNEYDWVIFGDPAIELQ